VFGVFVRDGREYAAGPLILESDWRGYEQSFLDFSFLMGIGIALVYLVVVVPVLILALKLASGMNHHEETPGEYSLQSLLFPLRYAKTLLQMFHSFLISPYFWAFESFGIIIILIYMAIAGEAWKSTTASIAFVFSGLAAFIVPFLWSVAWWYADYREREPLRIIVTMFLWGMLSALIVIGINSFADEALGVAGLAVLGTFLIAPVVEELSKGSGLTLLSEHHEFDSVEDGFIFGFVIGMGFSFVENWLYFLGNPLGSDTLGWFVLFVLRSVIFSANHGLYTAITGGVMGYFIERKFKAPALALLVGFPVAAFLHAMHNSGGAVISLLGGSGALLYCCILIPLFDYGGFIVLLLFFIRAVIRQKGA
jgi:RsiW-degrading membrane proteinase PrsW (M82 family)